MPARISVRCVLFIGPCADEHASLQQIFRDSPWDLQGAFTGRDGLGLLSRTHGICVVICDHCLPDGDWRGVLAEVNNMQDRPAFIVSSRLADERLWAEALNLGAFDLLLGSPFDSEEVLRVTQSASLASREVGERGNARRPGAEFPRDCVEPGR
jgi:DNA-binding NtrC family response regulator